ncbi:MAG TPA: hypothetical protein VH643_26865 [Gemmataceae bacterium]|jgi:hypothetical protein
MDALDERIRMMAGPESTFDPVMRDFLGNSRDELRERCRTPGLLEAVDLGEKTPWLWRLNFATRGLVRDGDGAIRPVERHVVAVRFLPDYLRNVNRFEMLALMEPQNAFHPNLRDSHICLEVYPGEPLLEICEALHALFAWRLRQLVETDALNPTACVWGRAHLHELPLDSRPLFGRALSITLEAMEEVP